MPVPAPELQPVFAYPPVQPMVDPKVEAIIAHGTKIGKLITAKLVAPFVFGASKLAGMAGALPPLLSAQGAFLGKLIAVPIEVGAVASSGLVSGTTGVLVGVPVGLGTGAAVAFHQMKPYMTMINAQTIKAFLNKKLHPKLAGHHHLMQPVAVLDGGKAFLLGSAAHLMGVKMQALGKFLSKAGYKTSAAGQALSMQHSTPVIAQPMIDPQQMVSLPALLAVQGAISQVNAHETGAVAAVVPVPQQALAPIAGSGSAFAVASANSGNMAPVPQPIPVSLGAPISPQ